MTGVQACGSRGWQIQLDMVEFLPSNGGMERTAKSPLLAAFCKTGLPTVAVAVPFVVRNDNDSNPNPGWDRFAFRN